MDRIPVTIITGFLGSGKTTLLNRILDQNKGKRIAIIENEFGDLNIDRSLITSENDGIYELSNGCICCSLNSELITVLSKLIRTAEPPEYLVIETTGLADPTSIVLSFISDVVVQSAFELDAVITLVDALMLNRQLKDHPEVNKQLALADVIVLNKSDLVSQEEIDQLSQTIEAYNPQAKKIITHHAVVNEPLLYQRAFRAENVQRNMKADKPRFYVDHLAQTSSLSLVFDRSFDFLLFNNWMNYQLNGRCGELYRCKGVLHVEHFEQKVIFQGVYDQHMVQMGSVWGEEEERISRLVFIGKKLQTAVITAGLEQCLTEA
ncbi:MAG: cobalamin synthesis protein CobW [Chitinophagaceae bacterium]|nr:cobalamin synthesis protein CobW [Chitinophagaceae bacterium]